MLLLKMNKFLNIMKNCSNVLVKDTLRYMLSVSWEVVKSCVLGFNQLAQSKASSVHVLKTPGLTCREAGQEQWAMATFTSVSQV